MYFPALQIIAAPIASCHFWIMFELQAKSKTAVDIMMYGTISEWGKVNADDFYKALKKAEEDGYKTVNLRVNSPGGSIFEGLAIIGVIKGSPLDIDMYIDGLAASMMSAVAMSVRKVYMAKGARMMIHQGHGGVAGSAKQIINYGKLLISLNETMAEFIADRTGKDQKWILDNWMSEGQDKWFKFSEAEEAGLVDGESDKKIKPFQKEAAEYTEMAAHYQEQLENQNKDTMKEKLIEKYGLKADATEEEIMAAIAADKEKTTPAKKPEDKPAASGDDTAESVDAFIAMGKKAGLINKDNEAAVKTMAEKAGLKATSEFLNGFEASGGTGDNGERLSDVIAKALKSGGSANAGDKKLEDYTPEELDDLEAKDPAAFEALFKASKYGKVNTNPEG